MHLNKVSMSIDDMTKYRQTILQQADQLEREIIPYQRPEILEEQIRHLTEDVGKIS